MSAGLPPIDPATLPADVRHGTRAHRQAYEAALGFERMLVGQLTKTLSQTAQSDDDSSPDAAGQTYRTMLPDTLADAITSAGGLGLARQMVPVDPTAQAATRKAAR